MYNKNFSKEPTEKQKVGQLGEDAACKHLEKLGYKIIERNYLRKWGELDIIAQKGKKLHFLEVKSVSRETHTINSNTVPHVTSDYRPEDNMHHWKLKRLGRAVQSYLLEKDISDDIDWQFDVATVYVDQDKKIAKVYLLEDIVI